MDSPGGIQAETEGFLFTFFIFFITVHETVPMKGGLNGVMAFTAYVYG